MIMILTGLFPEEGQLAGLQMTDFFLYPQMAEKTSFGVSSFLVRALIPSQDSILMTSLKANYFPKASPLKVIARG